MGAVDTTYTFTATDTITSAKMNNIIDQTTITTDAIIGTTLEVASGKLKIRSAGITSNEMGSASVTQSALASNVAGNGPAFSAIGSLTNQAVTSGATTKVQLPIKQFDTSNAFNATTNYRFQPSVAGYYQINAVIRFVGNIGTMTLCYAELYKNGIAYLRGNEYTYTSNFSLQQVSLSGLVYLNGSSDYIELFGRVDGTNVFFANEPTASGNRAGCCWMDGFLARSA